MKKSLRCLSIFILLLIMCTGCNVLENNEDSSSVSIPVQSASQEMEAVSESFKPYETEVPTTQEPESKPKQESVQETSSSTTTPQPSESAENQEKSDTDLSDTHTSISVEGMSVEEYLEKYGMEEYTSEYIHLKPVEGIIYVPNYSFIEIYYNGFQCGILKRMIYMAESGWDQNKRSASWILHGPRTMYEEMDITSLADVPYLVLANYRRDELYGLPTDWEWLLEDEVFLCKEDTEMETYEYEVLYGTGEYLYAYRLNLYPYFVNNELLHEMIRAVTFTEKSFTNETSMTKYSTIELTGKLQGEAEQVDLKMRKNPKGNLEFKYYFRVGDTVYNVPEGTVAIRGESGWELYAYISWMLTKIGTIELISVEEHDEEAALEEIAKKYIEEHYLAEGLSVTEYGFEYNATLNNIKTHCVFDKNSSTMLVAEYFEGVAY